MLFSVDCTRLAAERGRATVVPLWMTKSTGAAGAREKSAGRLKSRRQSKPILFDWKAVTVRVRGGRREMTVSGTAM
jgi:hypothetical protein